MTAIETIRELVEMLESIRAKSAAGTMGSQCDLPAASAPHTREEHLESQIRLLHAAATSALEALPDRWRR